MKLFMVNTRPYVDPDFCFLRKIINGLGGDGYRLAEGLPTQALYPKDASIQLADEDPGMKLPSLVGNTKRLLVVEDAIKDVIEELEGSNVECLPLIIKNHKAKNIDKSYWVINPLDFVDCLDLKASEIDFRSNGEVARVHKHVIIEGKLDPTIDIFRIPQDATRYIISENLARKIAQLKPTNFTVDAVDLV